MTKHAVLAWRLNRSNRLSAVRRPQRGLRPRPSFRGSTMQPTVLLSKCYETLEQLNCANHAWHPRLVSGADSLCPTCCKIAQTWARGSVDVRIGFEVGLPLGQHMLERMVSTDCCTVTESLGALGTKG